MGSDLLSRSALEAEVAGRRVHLPYAPAAVWIQHHNPLSLIVFHLADPAGQDAIRDGVAEGYQAVRDMEQEGRRILGQVVGRKWYQAQKLISASAGTEVLGRLLLAGLDPWQRSIGEWCAATYALHVKGLDQKERAKLDFSLALPPRGAEDEWDDEGSDPEATMNAMAAW